MTIDSPILQELINTEQQEEKPRLCVNCEFIATNPAQDWERFRCMAPQNDFGINLVTGNRLYYYEFCKQARDNPKTAPGDEALLIPSCGPLGNWYKRRTTPALSSSLLVAKELNTTEDAFSKDDLAKNRAAAERRIAELRARKSGAPKISASDLENL